MLATLCQEKAIMRRPKPSGWTWVVSQVMMRFIVGKSRTRKSTARMRNIDAPTPITPHLNTTVEMIATKKTKMEITEAGRLVDSSSVATLACAEMELTMDGQMLRAIRAQASLYSPWASRITQKRIPAVASVAMTICRISVRK